jgi:hypothetical protein
MLERFNRYPLVIDPSGQAQEVCLHWLLQTNIDIVVFILLIVFVVFDETLCRQTNHENIVSRFCFHETFGKCITVVKLKDLVIIIFLLTHLF